MVAERQHEREVFSTMYIGRMDTREEWLPVNTLVIPDEYQRHYNPAWAKKIGREFKMERLTKISVNRRPDGTLAIIDGQHRIGGIRHKFGEDTDLRVVCDVYSLATVQEEADQFLAMNHYVRTTDTKATFKALLAAGDTDAMELHRIAESFGFKLGMHSKWPDGSIPVTALLTVRKQHDRLGWSVITELLSVIRDAYGTDTSKLQSRVVIGIGSFIATYRKHPDYRRERLIYVLRHEGQLSLARKTRDMQVMLNSSQLTGGRKAVLALYNHKLATRRLPDV